MKKNFLKRSLALAVAAAMTISSVPTNLVFAEEDIVMVDEIVDDAVVSDEGEAQTIDASEPVSVEVEGVEQIDSDEVPANVAANIDLDALSGADGIAPISMAAPYKVSNLRVEDDQLKWHVDETYPYYEFSITDGTYSYFNYSVDPSTNTPTFKSFYRGDLNVADHYEYSTFNTSIINSATAYSNATGVWEQVKVNPADPSSDLIDSLRDGVTYKIDVRPIGENANHERVEGQWTGTPVEYTYKAGTPVTKPAAPTDFRYEIDEDGNGTLKWTRPATGRVDRYRFVITDDSYRYGSLQSELVDAATSKYVYNFIDPHTDKRRDEIDPEDISGTAYINTQVGAGVGLETRPDVGRDAEDNLIDCFEPGKTYTVQIYAENSGNDANGNYVVEKSDLSAAVSVTIPSVPTTMGKIENLTLEDTVLSWDDVDVFIPGSLRKGYEIVITDSAGAIVYSNKDDTYRENTDTSRSYDMDDYVSVSENTPPGTYNITVRAYVWKDAKGDGNVEDYVRDGYGEPATISYVLEETQGGNKSVPAKVTGFVLKTDNEDIYDSHDKYSNPKLAWNKSENLDVDRYDIELTDASGRVYYYYSGAGYYNSDKDSHVDVDDSTNVRTEKLLYFSTEETEVDVSSFKDCYTYALPADASLTRLTDGSGKFLTGFDAGQTYTVRVRAVDVYKTYDDTGKKNEDGTAIKKWTDHDNAGEWSDAKTYQVGSISAIEDLKYVPDTTGRKGDYYYFSFTAMPGTVYYQMSTDPTFDKKNPNTDSSFTSYSSSTYRLCIEKGSLLPNTTYYIRAVNVMGSKAPTFAEVDELMAKYPGMVTSFTTDPATPKAITDLALDEENKEQFVFTFGAIFEPGDRYVLQYSKDQVTWDTAFDSEGYSKRKPFLSKTNLEDGTYYVRVMPVWVSRDNKWVDGTPSNVVTISVNRAAGAVTGFAMKKTQYGYEFSYTNVFKNNERVQLQVADSTEFVENGDRTMIYGKKIGTRYFGSEYPVYDQYGNIVEYQFEESDTQLITYESLTPGKKYYARARVCSEDAKAGEQYGPWTNVITITPKVAKITVSTVDVGSTELYLTMSKTYDEDYLSGYQIQRKKGKKWVTLAYTTDDTYKDGGLTAQTKYQYRVRPYYYDAKAKKKYIYGSYVNCEVMTWGGALNLKAQAKSKTSVKLSWSKVSGAEGYEIYRTVMSSGANERKADASSDWGSTYSSNFYESKKLVKTIKKASTKSYTDKKLTNGMTYSYEVRAYKTIGKTKYYISETNYVDLSLKDFRIVDATALKNGKIKISWSPVYSGKGYLIEKQDDETGKWSTLKTIKKAKTSSYTLPANKTSKTIKYRVRAYDKSGEYSDPAYAYTNPSLKAPTGVKAVVQKDGSVKVTWKKVSGADYYVVYRTTSSWSSYDQISKKYSHLGGSSLVNYVEDPTTLSGYRATDADELTGTTLFDRKISYTTASGVENTLWKGPEEGVQYYYYVQAVKKGEAYIWKNDSWDSEETITSGSSDLATATVVKKAVPVPKKVKAKASKGSVKLSWKKVKGAKGYVVYRSTKKKTGYVPVGVISKAKTKTYTDKTAQKGKTYYYKVCAYKISAVGSYQYSKASAVKKVKAK